MAPVLRVTGLRETVSALRTVEKALPRELRSAGLAAAVPVAAEGARRAPRGGPPSSPDDKHPGRLASTVRPGATQRGAVVRAGGARAPYAGIVHFRGWPQSGIPPRPFLYEAADRRALQVAAIYQARVARLIASAGL